MRSRHLAAIVGLVCTLVGCSQNGAAPPQATVINTAEAAPSAGASAAAGAHSEAQEPDGSATPTGASITPANPATYVRLSGTEKEHSAFAFPADSGYCSMYSGSVEWGAPPTLVCYITIADPKSVFDRGEAMSGRAESVIIDGRGVYGGIHPPVHGDDPPVLPVGSSLTVAHMTCQVPAAHEVRCEAATGEFVVASSVFTIVRDEPQELPVGGAAIECQSVTNGYSQHPVFIYNGDVECPEALSVMQEYIDNGYGSSGGTAAEAEIQGYLCLRFSLAESEQNGIAKFCQRDDDLIVLPQES